MNAYGLSDSLAGVSFACERCGSVARLGNGLCARCFLQPALEGPESDRETFATALAAVKIPDVDWRLGNYQISKRSGAAGWA